jgi:hypothetical protein
MQGKAGYEELEAVMNALVAGGCVVNRADGMHVHHEALEYKENTDLVVRAMASWHNNTDNINKLVAARRATSGVCRPLTPEEIEGYKVQKRAIGGRYRAFNPVPLGSKGTIELRLHEGSLDYTKAAAWVEFGQAFLARVPQYRKPIRKFKNVDTLLNRLQVSKAAKERLLVAARTRGDEPVVEMQEFYNPVRAGGIPPVPAPEAVWDRVNFQNVMNNIMQEFPADEPLIWQE